MAQAAKHRHAPDTGYARGEETRKRIVVTALKLFGERGFDGASTREIASAAGVNAPALQYYFDSKEGLYLACVEHIVEQVWQEMSDVVQAAERLLKDHASDAELIEAFCAIQARMADFMFTSSGASDWRLFMARQQAGMEPAAGFEILYERVNKRMSAVTAGIVGRLIGRSPRDSETVIRTVALNGQMVVFQIMRRTVLTALNWDSMNATRLAQLKRIVREHTTTLLESMSALQFPRHRANRIDEGAQRRRHQPLRRIAKVVPRE
jgi:AcrR family transcriptional regulator